MRAGLTMIPNSNRVSPWTGLWRRWQRQQVLRVLARISSGQLLIHDSEGTSRLGHCHANPLEIDVKRNDFYPRVFWGGGLGAAESLMEGDWSCRDLTGLIRLMIRNLSTIDRLGLGWGRCRRVWERIGHWRRRNSRRQARRNIEQHYDLGNSFFALFLDRTMNYSGAIFNSLDLLGSESLQRGQLNKMERLCQTLQLQPDDQLLEIGSGWGSLACFAAKHFGCRVTTTTISHEQLEWVRRRVIQEGLEDRVTVLDLDYRDLTGRYDKIISVEMIEAVGDQYFDAFFRKCRSLLKPDGTLLLQAITIVEQRYREHLRNVDFICKHIFPGGSLPSNSRLIQSAAQAAELRLVFLQDFTPHYAETLRRWRARFQQNLNSVRELGFGDRFIRMWDYYFAYCEAAFEERQIQLVHLLFALRDGLQDPSRRLGEMKTASHPLEIGQPQT